MALDETGGLLASDGSDGRVRLWDIAGGAAAARPLASVDLAAGQVVSLAFSGDGRRLAAGTSDGRARTFDLRAVSLLANGPAPSARAALIEAALLRLWRLAPDGMDFVDEAWPRIQHKDDYPVPVPETVAEGAGRTSDLAPLFPPPHAGRGKLDQLLDWLAAQGR